VHGIGWFSTARDRAALDLFDAVLGGIRDGRVRSEFRYVFTNGSPDRNPLVNELKDRAQSAGIPFIRFPSSSFLPEDRTHGQEDKETLHKWRIAYDREVMKRLAPFSSDCIVLAGYMLIVGAEMCSKHTMINLHPALPTGPAGSWQSVIHRLIRTNAEETGVMIHVVTEHLDSGPPLAYCRFSIQGGPFQALWEEIRDTDLERLTKREIEGTRLFREIRRQGFVREIPLLLATLEKLSRGELRIENHRVLQGPARLHDGLDLSVEIEAAIRERSSP
jgi:folate-dependent phosphoribosylglycinamide formyltransferase PurN